MKRTTKPPQPPMDPGRPIPTPLPRNISPFKLPAVPAPPSSSRRGGNTRPPPALPSAAAAAAATSRQPPQPEYEDPPERHPAPTLPFVPTPLVEWEPGALPEIAASSSSSSSSRELESQSRSREHYYPSSGPTPAAPAARPFRESPPSQPSSNRTMEASLRNQIWSGLANDPQLHQQQQQQQQQQHAAMSSGSLRSAQNAGPVSSGSYPSPVSSIRRDERDELNRQIMIPEPAPMPADDGGDQLPLGYVVISAFFLAIAVVGFGLYLAFEVISL